jgi:acetyl esterase
MIQTAEFDPLRSEGEAYARRLSEAGVKVKLQRRAGLTHGFGSLCAAVPQARAAIEEAILELRALLHQVNSKLKQTPVEAET